MHFGFDISSNNPGLTQADFNTAAAFFSALGGGAQPLCIVKVNQGTTYLNPTLAAYVAMARGAGFVVAGYLMDEGPADPAAEEALFQRTVDLPQADDVELPEGLSTEQYIAHAGQLVAVHPDELDYLNQSEVAEGFPQGWGLWLAQYNGQPGVTEVPCDLHQYTSTLVIPGVNATFDANAWTGSEARFSQFFRLSAIPLPEGIDMASLQVVLINGQPQAFYVDTAGDIVQLEIVNGAWVAFNVSNSAKAPKAAV